MALKLDTPAAAQTKGAIAVTWTTAKTDPKFTLILQRQDANMDIDVATGIDPTTLKATVNIGAVPPGTYKLQAVQAADIAVPLASTGTFQITAAGAGGNNAAAASTCAPPVTVTVSAAAGAATVATGKSGKGQTGKKGFGFGQAAKAGKNRSLFSAKFGRRELFRE
ncbi:hypothetical protein FB45DRAFT_399337 [Roridomyces roridus]|uniref:Uncharacterized protein n=1 Tax=Roridomyces roridus TaxID=1738132 RepID=A0AAD7FU72_9AGAR|nr:hypothetical protein FB45DRAFT_399337 [Roridomyces roridus]